MGFSPPWSCTWVAFWKNSHWTYGFMTHRCNANKETCFYDARHTTDAWSYLSLTHSHNTTYNKKSAYISRTRTSQIQGGVRLWYTQETHARNTRKQHTQATHTQATHAKRHMVYAVSLSLQNRYEVASNAEHQWHDYTAWRANIHAQYQSQFSQ